MSNQLKLLIVFTILSTMFSCTSREIQELKNDPVNLYNSVQVDEAKKFVESRPLSGRENKNDFWQRVKPSWSNSYVETSEYGTYLVVPTRHPVYYYLGKEDNGSMAEYKSKPIKLIVFRNKSGELKSYYFVVADKNKSSKSNDWIKTYTGSIIYHELSGEIAFVRNYSNGKRLFTTEELPSGPASSGRCGWGFACYYTALDIMGDKKTIYGHPADDSFNKCELTMNINGRSYSLSSSESIWLCDNNDPRFPPDASPIPAPAGGGGDYVGEYPPFRMSQLDQQRFPKFTEVVRGLKTFVQNDKSVRSALVKWASLPESELLNRIGLDDNGPEIRIHPISQYYGFFDPENPENIYIDETTIQSLENSNNDADFRAYSFLLAVTVLHEFVHQSYAQTGKPENVERGFAFEKSAFAVTIDIDNAGKYSFRLYRR